MGNASVRFIKNSISYQTWRAMGDDRAGGGVTRIVFKESLAECLDSEAAGSGGVLELLLRCRRVLMTKIGG